MRRAAVLTAGALLAAVWAGPALADSGYPPLGPSGGGGGALTGGGGGAVMQTRGSGAPSVTLPYTGADLMTPLELGAASLVAGTGLLVLARRRRAPRR